MKNLIILLSLILLSSCGSYQLSTVGYTPIKQPKVIIHHPTTPWYYSLTDPTWRWHYYQRNFSTPVIIVKPTPVVRVKGRRGLSNGTRSTSNKREYKKRD